MKDKAREAVDKSKDLAQRAASNLGLAKAPAIDGVRVAPGGGAGEISISWDAIDDDGVTHYQVYRADQGGGPYLEAGLVTNEQHAWWPAGRRGLLDVEQFEERSYIVRAVMATGLNGPFTAEASGSSVFRPK